MQCVSHFATFCLGQMPPSANYSCISLMPLKLVMVHLHILARGGNPDGSIRCFYGESKKCTCKVHKHSVSPRVNLALKHPLLSTSNHVRHLVCAPRCRRYHGSTTCYYANSDSSFQQSRLLTSGDVSINPGPSSNPPKCSVCSKSITRNHRALSCDRCEKWCHIKYGNVKPSEYKNLQRLTTFD